jgi:hypothetical protein
MGPSQGTRLARLLAKVKAFNGEGARFPGRWVGGPRWSWVPSSS